MKMLLITLLFALFSITSFAEGMSAGQVREMERIVAQVLIDNNPLELAARAKTLEQVESLLPRLRSLADGARVNGYANTIRQALNSASTSWNDKMVLRSLLDKMGDHLADANRAYSVLTRIKGSVGIFTSKMVSAGVRRATTQILIQSGTQALKKTLSSKWVYFVPVVGQAFAVGDTFLGLENTAQAGERWKVDCLYAKLTVTMLDNTIGQLQTDLQYLGLAYDTAGSSLVAVSEDIFERVNSIVSVPRANPAWQPIIAWRKDQIKIAGNVLTEALNEAKKQRAHLSFLKQEEINQCFERPDEVKDGQRRLREEETRGASHLRDQYDYRGFLMEKDYFYGIAGFNDRFLPMFEEYLSDPYVTVEAYRLYRGDSTRMRSWEDLFQTSIQFNSLSPAPDPASLNHPFSPYLGFPAPPPPPPSPAPAPAGGGLPTWMGVVHMYRAYNPNAAYHFFTTSLAEFSNAVRAGYRNEDGGGRTFSIFMGSSAVLSPAIPGYNNLVGLHRLRNPNNGRHYYTTGDGERDILVSRGWRFEKDEGYVWARHPGVTRLTVNGRTCGVVTIERFYHPASGVHLYLPTHADGSGMKSEMQRLYRGIWDLQTPVGYALFCPND